MKTKVIALYLPQFHEIKENNEWWGEGFTEWTHVKKAKPLFKGHCQPKVPENENYYDLTNKETVEWQTALAKQYGIDGFAYYHYWFNGKLLMEKPAENLLKWSDIQQNFFFFWANHTWYKTENGRKKELIRQTYGAQDDWANHYNYMRKFFLDNRYMKIDNKPIVGIYVPNQVVDYEKMIAYWSKYAIKDGFNGIYIIERCIKADNIRNTGSQKADSIVLMQPDTAMRLYRKNQLIVRRLKRKLFTILKLPNFDRYDYRKIAQLESDIDNYYNDLQKKKIFYCISAGWDNTPRHGRYGKVMINMSFDLFEATFKNLYIKSISKDNELLFINAWNEWAEGMMLEPDADNSTSMLQRIKLVINSSLSERNGE